MSPAVTKCRPESQSTKVESKVNRDYILHSTFALPARNFNKTKLTPKLDMTRPEAHTTTRRSMRARHHHLDRGWEDSLSIIVTDHQAHCYAIEAVLIRSLALPLPSPDNDGVERVA